MVGTAAGTKFVPASKIWLQLLELTGKLRIFDNGRRKSPNDIDKMRLQFALTE